jgi:hypothetical protein
MNSKLYLDAYKQHYEQLELKALTKRKRSLTNLKNSNEELTRVRKELEKIKQEERVK